MKKFRVSGLKSILLMSCVLAVGGCAKNIASRAAINSDDVNERILAVRQAAESRDKATVPLLVDRLEDEDDAVRFFAILALERITGQRFGYDYAQSAGRRAKSVEMWRSYVKAPDRALSMENERATDGRASSGASTARP